jgi:hypothetical protein
MNISNSLAGRGQRIRLQSIQTLLSNQPKLIDFLFKSDKAGLNAAPKELLRAAGVLSHGEMVLLLIALDIWSNDGGVSLTEAVETLDSSNWILFIQALEILGGTSEPNNYT